MGAWRTTASLIVLPCSSRVAPLPCGRADRIHPPVGGLFPESSSEGAHGPVADGRLIPVLVIDTARRPDIRELICWRAIAR